MSRRGRSPGAGRPGAAPHAIGGERGGLRGAPRGLRGALRGLRGALRGSGGEPRVPGGRPRRPGEVGRRIGGERGAVTAELAVGLVTVVALLGLVLGLVAAGVAQVRCVDAARAGARVAALGQDDAAVATVATRSAGPSAEVSVERSAGWVDVTVRLPVLGGRVLGDLAAGATAGVPEEP